MALTDTTTLLGTIQKYFETAWMDQPMESFRTPLCNSDKLQTASIPKNNGQYAEMRKFDHFTVEVESATDDSPKTYAENSEPTSPVSTSTTLIQIPFELFRDYIEVGAVQAATDPINLMKKYKALFFESVRRKCHQLTNGHMVKGVDRVMQSSAIPPAATYLPQGFKTLFAGGVESYENLGADDVFTMRDLKRARSRLANAYVPRFPDGTYCCVIDEAVKDQLLDDVEFKDAVKRHEAMYEQTAGKGVLARHEGMSFMLQDDSYRCKLSSQSGSLTTRQNSGSVHLIHIFGPDAAGYVPFGGAKTLQRTKMKPAFKVQDISKTGTGPTIGYTLPFQAAVIDRRRGLNIAGTTRYDEPIDDVAE